jgi:hypothetical protein
MHGEDSVKKALYLVSYIFRIVAFMTLVLFPTAAQSLEINITILFASSGFIVTN